MLKSWVAVALDGEGGRPYGGRWNSPGIAVVYLASSASLALVELLVHLNPDLIPPAMQLLTVEIPDEITGETLNPLPDGWNHDPPSPECRMAGDAWARSAILIVPSVTVSQEYNILMNPLHPEGHRVAIISSEPFSLDRRFFHVRKA